MFASYIPEQVVLRRNEMRLPSLHRVHVSEHHGAADERYSHASHSGPFNLSGHVWDYRIGVGLTSLSSPAFHAARQQDNKEETPVTLMTELQYPTERSLFANTEIGEACKLTIFVRIAL